MLTKKDIIVPKIRNALEHIRVKNHEPPYIANYCKEYVQPELQINDIWRIYYFDEDFCKLYNRKKSLRRHAEQLQQYMYQLAMPDRDALEAPINEDIEHIQDSDLEKIDAISTDEQLKDMERYYKFYYSKYNDKIKVSFEFFQGKKMR